MDVTIIFVVIDNEDYLEENGDPAYGLIWKKSITLANIDPSTDTNPDWCYDRILEHYPEFEEYTIAVWGIDKE